MSTQVASLYGLLELRDDQFKRGLNEAERGLQGLTATLGRVETTLRTTGRAMTLGVTVPIVGALGGVTREFNRFENQMNEVFTLLPDISREAMRAMQDDVLDLSLAMSIMPDQVVPALYQAISAGIPEENVFAFMETASRASIGGVTTLETAVDGISTVMNIYGHEVMSAEKASDLMFTTVRLGKTNFEELSRSAYVLFPALEAVGAGAEIGFAGIAALTAGGRPTSVAMTQLRQLTNELADSGRGVGEVFTELAGKTFQQFIESGGDLGGAIAILEDHATELNIPLGQLFSSVEASGAAMGLSGEGAERYAQAMIELADAAGATDEAFDRINEGGARDWQELMVQLRVGALIIGQQVAPVLSDFLANTLRPLIREVLAWTRENEGAVRAMLMVAAGAAALGPVLFTLGLIVGALKGALMLAAGAVAVLTSPIWLAVAAGAALGYAIYSLMDHFGVIDAFRDVVVGAFGIITGAIEGVISLIASIPALIGSAADAVATITGQSSVITDQIVGGSALAQQTAATQRRLTERGGVDVRGSNLFYGGGRATGGPVTGGTAYTVGERGPELFVPGASGTIIPNHRMGAGTVVIQHVTVAADDLPGLYDAIMREADRRS